MSAESANQEQARERVVKKDNVDEATTASVEEGKPAAENKPAEENKPVEDNSAEDKKVEE